MNQQIGTFLRSEKKSYCITALPEDSVLGKSSLCLGSISHDSDLTTTFFRLSTLNRTIFLLAGNHCCKSSERNE